jgi:ribonuclease P protein subunit RPR2
MISRKKLLERIARERIEILFNLAYDRARRGDLQLARRYVEIATKITRKAQIKLPRKYKRSYCRRCFAPLIPGLTLRVRIKSEGKGSRVVYRCLLCGWTRRFMIKTSKKASKSE